MTGTHAIVFLALLVLVPGFFHFAGLVQRRLALSHESSRKLVHIVSGIVAGLAPLLLGRWELVAGSTALLVILPAGAYAGLFPGVVREGRTILGPIMFLLAFIFIVATGAQPWETALIFLVLGISDAAASIVGMRFGRFKLGPENSRTWEGTASFFVTALLICEPGLFLFSPMQAATASILAFFIAGGAAAVEAVSGSASDNLTVPLAIYALLHVGGLWPAQSVPLIAMLAAGCVVLCGISMRAKWLTGDGALAVLAVGLVLIASRQYAIVVAILVFFVSSSLLTRLAPDRAVQADAKHGRSARQVTALGLIPAVGSVFALLSGQSIWVEAALAAIAAGAADTWAAEIGRRASHPPRLITTGQVVRPGTAGAVSPLGLAASLAAALLTTGAAALLPLHGAVWWYAALAGFAGGIIDSYLGAVLQAQYRCERCGHVGDLRRHCAAASSIIVQGTRHIDNETVNFLMSMSAALAILIYHWLTGWHFPMIR